MERARFQVRRPPPLGSSTLSSRINPANRRAVGSALGYQRQRFRRAPAESEPQSQRFGGIAITSCQFAAQRFFQIEAGDNWNSAAALLQP